jgi:hypothetical protein
MSRLPLRTYSFRDYIRTAKDLLPSNEDDDSINFQQFILTGENIRDNCQAFVDPTQNAIYDSEPLNLARDYDSLIGVTENIVTQGSICVYPAPNPAEVLRKSIHMAYPVSDGEVSII